MFENIKNIALLSSELEIILGGLLGDSCLRTGSTNTVQFRHSKKQEEYIKWKYENLKNLTNGIYEYIDTNGFEYIVFTTKSNKHLRKCLYDELNALCINNNKKVLTRKWLNLLTPLSLAVWWMDDGCLSIHKGNRYGKLCTHNYSYEEHLIIKKYFKIVWDIDIQIKLEKQKYYFCRLNVENLKKIIKIIYPYIIKIPSMIYKIDLKYVNKLPEDFKDIIEIINSSKI